jgi:hypothetical protein
MNVCPKQPPDGAKARRKYLLTRAALLGKVLGNDFWTAVSVFATIACGIGALFLIGVANSRPLWLLAAMACGALTWLGVRMSAWYYGFLVEARRELAELPVVPPVREQIEALPAEAVLVRPSDGVAAHQKQLLRAANISFDHRSETMLRPTVSPKGTHERMPDDRVGLL